MLRVGETPDVQPVRGEISRTSVNEKPQSLALQDQGEETQSSWLKSRAGASQHQQALAPIEALGLPPRAGPPVSRCRRLDPYHRKYAMFVDPCRLYVLSAPNRVNPTCDTRWWQHSGASPEDIIFTGTCRPVTGATWRRNCRHVNRLFTVTGKKLGAWRKNQALYPRAVSTRRFHESQPTLGVSTSDVGVSMKIGFPRRIKGIGPDARRIAEEAAHQAGLPLSDWLNAAILQRAAAQGIKASSLPCRGGEEPAYDLSDLHMRLDDLTRRIDQVTRGGSAAYPPRQDREESDRFAELFARLEQRFDQLADNISRHTPRPMPSANASALDRAIAEIAARRYLLNGEPTLAPVHDLTSLEGQLRRIADQIETLGHPGIEEAIAALRVELGEFARTLNEAMPRHAIETIKKQIQGLAYRIAEGLEASVDRRAFAGIEHGLAEVRDAVQGLTPAENFIRCTEVIDVLAQKIDFIMAQWDPATMQQLEKSIGTLHEMAAHVASNETVSSLSARVQALADKVEHLAIGGDAGDAFDRIELRIDALSRAVSEGAHNSGVVPSRLEGLFQSLSEKVEQIQHSRRDHIALAHLEDLIAKLVQRLDATNFRTPVPELQKPFTKTTADYTLSTSRPPQADQPLDPRPDHPGFGAHPDTHIATSEVILGVERPNRVTPGSQSSFIAAARRAAHAARQDPKNDPARLESHKRFGGQYGSLRGKVATSVKGMLLAASIVAIIVGSIQFTSNTFDFGIFDWNANLTSNFETDNANSVNALQDAENETTGGIASDKFDRATDTDLAATLLAPPTLPSLTPARPVPKAGGAAVPLPLNSFDTGGGPSLVLNPPLLNPPLPGESGPKSDDSGSVVRPPAEARPNRQPAPGAQPRTTDGLPAAIGGAQLRNAASAGDPAAAYEVAMRFLEGRGVPANLEEAARWYERAASKGLAPAQFRYASMLEKGQGVKKDLVAAQKLYAAAATKGHAKAMHNLAVIYAEGADGRPDYASAALWFRKAAEHGVMDSQYNFAVLAARGLGTEKNLADSYKWFALAAAQGDHDAGRKRDEVAVSLDAVTLATAQEAVKNFVVQRQPEAATVVPEPPGGWDRTAPSSQEKPRAAGQLSISAINSGKLGTAFFYQVR